MQKKTNLPENLSYHSTILTVPLDTSLIPELTDLLFSAISSERTVLVRAVAGLKKEVDHYKTLLLTEQEVSVQPGTKAD